MSTIAESEEVAIWRRIIRPETPGWTRAGAKAILHLGFQEIDHERMLQLLERAKSGELAGAKQVNSKAIGMWGTTLEELIQSRARHCLKSLAAV